MTTDCPAPVSRDVIISCQPSARSPWREPSHIAALTHAAQDGGAVAVRVDGPPAVKAARAATSLPSIAIWTCPEPGRAIAITPTFEHARQLVENGADIVAIDATVSARRHDGQDLAALISRIRAELDVPVMADVASIDDGIAAWDCGAALVGSSTDGYAPEVGRPGPNLPLVGELAARGITTVAERGFSQLEHVQSAFSLGAHAVVVGSAVVDPVFLTEQFAATTP